MNFSVNVGTGTVVVYKNLIDSYGEISLEQIRQTVADKIQGRDIRHQQTNSMMHVCILASLTEQAAVVIFLKIKEYKALNGEDSGLLFLNLVIGESTLETKSTVNHLWSKLTTGLPGIMTWHSNNIQLFKRDVTVIQEDLRAQGQNPDNIIPPLFSTYYNYEDTNSPLGQFIKFLENSYNSGTNIMASNLMFEVEEKYKELKERQLVQGSKKDDEIIPLKAELEAITKAPKRNNSDARNKTTKQKKTKWMFVKPKDGEPKSKKIGDIDYHWCNGKDDAHKPKWVCHHPRDCRRREQTASATTAATPAVAPAPAANAPGFPTDPS
jgi:hypothetical protein